MYTDDFEVRLVVNTQAIKIYAQRVRKIHSDFITLYLNLILRIVDDNTLYQYRYTIFENAFPQPECILDVGGWCSGLLCK